MAHSVRDYNAIYWNLNNRFEQNVKPHRATLSKECADIEGYLNQINPSHQKYTPFEHRRDELIGRIETIFTALRPKPSDLDILKKQRDEVQTLIAKLQTLSNRQIKKEVMHIEDEQLKNRILRAIWIVAGCPLGEPRFAELKLKEDAEVLTRRFCPWFSTIEGSILEQLAHDLSIEHQIETAKEAGRQPDADRLMRERDDAKLKVFEDRLKEQLKFNNYQMKELYQLMPDSVKSRASEKPPFHGRCLNPGLYKTLGAHYDRGSGKTTFRVYAPNARSIDLNLTAFGNVETRLPMQKKENGIWEVETQFARPGRSYYFMVVGNQGGEAFKKVDPFAFGNIAHCRLPGSDNHESVVRDIDKDFNWADAAWMASRVNTKPATTPMAIYEVHVPSWKKKDDGNPLKWRELADELGNYCKEMGYTHVVLLGAMEHPHPVSRDNQTSNFFTANSDLSTFEDFQFFVDHFHKLGIGVIADWAPSHFADKNFALHCFDGSPLFEDDDPEVAKGSQYGTYEFALKKQHPKDFLYSNLDFLLKKFHLDGIQVKVESMLDSKDNIVNLYAKTFLRDINAHAHKNYPGVLMIAEQVKGGFHNLTRPVNERGTTTKTRGVGFDLTWQTGFMDKVLSYFSTSPYLRNQSKEFSASVRDIDGCEDAYMRGKVVLALSRDEVPSNAETLFGTMGGNTSMSDSDKFDNGRLVLAHQLLRGGGPILDFMGNEILQTKGCGVRMLHGLHNPNERYKSSVQWEELDPRVDHTNHHYHKGARESRKALLRLYRDNPGLQDGTDNGICHLRADDTVSGVISFHRRGGGQQFTCIFNPSNNDLKDYLLPLPSHAPELEHLTGVNEVYTTDNIEFGGQGRVNNRVEILRNPHTNRPTHLKLRLPPFTAILLEEQF
jgi:1,4-alpha-glucan branching enzyme